MPDTLGLYIHIPFCKQKCNYCDFCSFQGLTEETRRQYLTALENEIRSYAGRTERTVDTVFFGGGTPSLLTPQELSRLFVALRESFTIASDAEITAEMNPGTVGSEFVAAFCEAGGNRVSLGLQSVHDAELKYLGRIHTYKDFLTAYRTVTDAGISNVGVDLMYAFPTQTVASFCETLRTVTALSPTHISAYALIVEDGTPFGAHRETLAMPSEDEEIAMYDAACDLLRTAGYRHYEVSNYAKPGYESRHNLRYWQDREYIGFGLAAHSYFEGARFSHSRSMADYLAGRGQTPPQRLGREETAFEYAMLGLRTADGIDLATYESRFGRPFLAGKEALVSRLRTAGYLTLSDGRLSFTERGFYVGNSLTAELL